MASVLSDDRFHNEQSAFEYIEGQLWPHGPICPHCGATEEKIGYLEGVRTVPSRRNPDGAIQLGLRKCYACRKTFTVRVGTFFEDSHMPLRMWLQAIHLLCASKTGISIRQLQWTLGCGIKAAWLLAHRIRHRAAAEKVGPVGGRRKSRQTKRRPAHRDKMKRGGSVRRKPYRRRRLRRAKV